MAEHLSAPISLRSEAQQALDELMNENALPFRLRANNVTMTDEGSYVVHFYDSRFRSITVSWTPGESFRDNVRAAVLEGLHKIDLLST
jgi:hypothetical protein